MVKSLKICKDGGRGTRVQICKASNCKKKKDIGLSSGKKTWSMLKIFPLYVYSGNFGNYNNLIIK